MKDKSQNNVNVRVKFINEYDGNFDCYSLRVEILYNLPEEFGFKKNKKLERYIFQNESSSMWVKKVDDLLLGGKVKRLIHKEIQEDIMKRLRFSADNNNDIMAHMLNALNQMKFHFSFDMKSAEEIIQTEAQVFKEEEQKNEDWFGD